MGLFFRNNFSSWHVLHCFRLLKISQDAGQTKPNGAQCALPQRLGSLCQNLVQPTRQEGEAPQNPCRQGCPRCSKARQVSDPLCDAPPTNATSRIVKDVASHL